jgi:hypothetical protein
MDYTRNEDKWSFNCPSDNLIEVVSVVEESGSDEPVSIQDFKDYARTEGWTESDATEFTFDDVLIAEVIASARSFVEDVADISLVPKTVTAIVTNAGDVLLKYFSSAMAVVSINDSNESAVETANIKLRGRKLTLPLLSDMTVVYTTTIFNDWRPLTDIKRIAFALYEARRADINTDAPTVSNDLALLLPSYSRKPMVV